MVVVLTVAAAVWTVAVVFVVAMCRVAASEDAARLADEAIPIEELEGRPQGEADRRSGRRGGPPPSSKRGLRGAKAFLSRCLRAPAAAQPR